jgi:acetyl esterase/lipase
VYAWCHATLPGLLQEKEVQVDGNKIVVMGHSAGGSLALVTGHCTPRPRAIVDFYGCKGFGDNCWFEPLPVFAGMPDLPAELETKIFEGKQAITSEAMFVQGKPNLADPRVAWYIDQVKHGKSLSAIVPDGDYVRCDPMEGVDREFSPTYFLHGTEDAFVPWDVSERAYEKLKALGARAEFVLAEGLGHAFDLQMEEGNELWGKFVLPALEWMKGFI